MNATKIKIELIKKGITQAEIARWCGVSRQMIGMVINKRCVSSRIQDRISMLIGKPKHKVFNCQTQKRNNKHVL